MNEIIKQTIQNALACQEIHILDPQNDGVHLEALVISDAFESKRPIERHQMVMAPLSSLFASDLHALALKTYTPSEWEQKRKDWNL